MKRLLSLFICFVMLAAALAVAQMRIEREPKDMDDVQRIYLAPFGAEDEQNAAFRAALKPELVHNRFIVLEKPEGADATLNVEITSAHDAKNARLEFHAMLDAGPDSRVSWHLSKTKTGSDLGKLVENGAREIANSLHTYRFDVVTKKQEKKEKQK